MKKLILAAALTMVVPVASAKVLISIDAGGGYNMNTLGAGSSLAGEKFMLDSDVVTVDSFGLNMEANNGFYGWASISLPVLPDIKVKYENLVISGVNNLTIDEVYGVPVNLTGDITSTLDLSHLDLAVTIGLPLPIVDIDFGVNARSLLGGFTAEIAGTDPVNAPFQIGTTPIIVPMGYLSVGATIPGVGVKLSGEISTLPIGDTKISDWNIKGTWFAPLPTNMLVKFGVEAGYRSYSMNIAAKTLYLDTSAFASDISVSGFFVGGTVHF